MVDIYEGELDSLYRSNRKDVTEAKADVQREDDTDFVSNFSAYGQLTARQSTYKGQSDSLTRIYEPTYKKLTELTGDSIGKEAYDIDPIEYAEYLELHKDKLKDLKEQGHNILSFEELLDSEAKELKSLNDTANDAFDGSFSAYAGWITGTLVGYVLGDPINASTLLVGAAPKLGVGILGNVLRGAARESTIQAGLEVRNKPGEVRARRLAGEDLTDDEAGIESLTSIGLSGAVGAAAGGIGRALIRSSPDEVVQDIARSAPEGVNPKEHTAKVLTEMQNVEAKVSKDNPAVPPIKELDAEPESIIDFNISEATREFKAEDLKIPSHFDEEGNVTKYTSTKRALQDYEQDKDILTKIKDCILR